MKKPLNPTLYRPNPWLEAMSMVIIIGLFCFLWYAALSAAGYFNPEVVDHILN